VTAYDDQHLHVVVHGPADATTVVLVHGAPDRSGSFRRLLEQLRDRHVVVYDRRGYGRSLSARPAAGMRDHANDLLDIVTRFDPPRVVVAHSFGSNPTMLAASLQPDAFAALGLWEPPMPWLPWWPQLARDIAATDDPEGQIELMYRQLMGEQRWHELPPDVRAQRRAEGHAFRSDMASELVAPFDIAAVTVPAVVGYGGATSDAHVRGALLLAEQLPDAQLHWVDGVGHFAHRTHPAQFASFVEAAIARAAS
jgi:pimeloyl-ACP methyl ester carboxylesterase